MLGRTNKNSKSSSKMESILKKTRAHTNSELTHTSLGQSRASLVATKHKRITTGLSSLNSSIIQEKGRNFSIELKEEPVDYRSKSIDKPDLFSPKTLCNDEL